MKNKKIVITLICLLTSFVLAACGTNGSESSSLTKLEQIKESGKLVLATSPDFPPNEFYILNENNEKEIVGSDISLAKAIADEIGVELEIKATDFNGVLANIQTGSVDFAIAGFAGTDERSKIMDFSIGFDQEVSDDYQGLLVSKDLVGQYATLDELKDANLTIGAQGGTIQYEMAVKLTDEKNVKQYGTIDAAVLALNAGDIQAVTVSTSSIMPMLSTFTNLEVLPKEGFDLDPENQYSTNVVGFPLSDNNDSFIEIVNKVIKTNEENGNFAMWKEESKALALKAVE